jgi:apolipoprotein N-acyltransferase
VSRQDVRSHSAAQLSAKPLQLGARHLVLLLATSFVLLNLSFPPYVRADGFPVWVALVPMLVAAKFGSYRRLALASWLLGWVAGAVSVLWLRHVSLAALLALGLYLSFYPPVFLVGWKFLDRRLQLPAALSVPILWVPLEYVRSFLLTGFPWFYLGHSLYRNLPLIQVADLVGAYGVSALVAAVNGAAVDALRLILPFDAETDVPSRGWRKAAFSALGVGLAFVGTLCYGYVRLRQVPVTNGPRVALIQGNIPQSLKFIGRSDEEIFEAHRRLSLASLAQGPDLIIWPETMLPGLYHRALNRFFTAEENFALEDRVLILLRELGRPLLAGVRSGEVSGQRIRQSNSAILLLPDGEVVARYDKVHLVVFGEYVPLLRYFPFLAHRVPYQLGLEAGTSQTIFTLPWQGRPFRFGVLICYEDTLPSLARGLAREGVDCLVNITNDGWFKGSPELDQHVIASVFRAIETRKPVLRAANTGITSVISPRGEEVARLRDPATGRDREVAGYMVHPVPLANPGAPTLYVRWGDRPAQVTTALALLLVVFTVFTAERRRVQRGRR